MKTRGRIHSYEVGSSVDGPGLRLVIFTQGCPLRCLYCHNPDTRDPSKGTEISVEELLHEINKYHAYFDHGHGGITVSGGEPLLQADFVASLFKEAKAQGLHTALDTSGFSSPSHLELVLPYTDLVLLDIKSSEPTLYHRLTHADLATTLQSAHLIDQRGVPLWVRFVLVPGLTDGPENIEGVARICSKFKNLERVEILPFHKLGAYKWKELGLSFELEQTPLPDQQAIDRAKDIFKQIFEEKYQGSPGQPKALPGVF